MKGVWKVFRKILVAVDGSEYSEKAASYALAIAEKFGSEVVVLHVVTTPFFFVGIGNAGVAIAEYGTAKLLAEELENAGKKLLEEYEVKFKEVGVKAHLVLKRGNPPTAIIETAKEEECDLVIVGSRGLGDVKRFLLGSVSDKVSRHAHCPVLIVR
ncbi:MAG: universal stress protein [Candidatus Freyarchaeota archaeon]